MCSPSAPRTRSRRSRLTPPSWSGECTSTRSGSTSSSPGTRRDGRWSGCRRWTGIILRIGAYELLWADDVPDAVAISEAVQLARDLSTEGSPAFVNGLLARLLELKPTLTL